MQKISTKDFLQSVLQNPTKKVAFGRNLRKWWLKISILLGRDVKIWKLLMLGRTQKEAGDIFEVDQSAISLIMSKLQTQIIHIQNAYYKDKKIIEQIPGKGR